MWTLWFFPLLIGLVVVGIFGGAAWYALAPAHRRPSIAKAVTVPFGCIGILVVSLVILVSIAGWFRKNDTQLFAELFGFKPTATEDRMLFDEFGKGSDRQIFMRAEPSSEDRTKIMKVTRARLFENDAMPFEVAGAQHGFSWWVSSNENDLNYCKTTRILNADGFHGWKDFRILECLDAGNAFPASANAGLIYVAASGRNE
ncbi:hypothetical protein [Sphingobium phenoxybenzoativorans]|uniref:hypothetical protein n=1 Tax=Sphingobium phenoxybenzoativorans TaxID=1592790 RepID=UPI001112F5F0|nr:hypothetical protein [Sphingobium phenoxybenzoativorans]